MLIAMIASHLSPEIRDRGHVLDARVVDQNIATPRVLDQAAAFVAFGHIRLNVARCTPVSWRFVGQGVIFVAVGEEFSTTSAPARASSQAMPKPMPELDPVITAVLPERSCERHCVLLCLVGRTMSCCTCERKWGAIRDGSQKGKKKRQHEAGVKLLRQVSYRQETYRAVTSL